MSLPYVFGQPAAWTAGVYASDAPGVPAARPFCLCHSSGLREAWLLVHGYKGYPGEMIRPAEDLFAEGYDVFTLRLPGCGSTARDFRRTGAADWVGCVKNALTDLAARYARVSVLSHSLGCAVTVCALADCPFVARTVYVAPAWVQKAFDPEAVREIRETFLPLDFHPDPSYRMHYENAPGDDPYLAEEYWKWMEPAQLLEFETVCRNARALLTKSRRPCLAVCPTGDAVYAGPSAAWYETVGNPNARIVRVPGTHLVLYDPSPEAEDAAMQAVLQYVREQNREKA